MLTAKDTTGHVVAATGRSVLTPATKKRSKRGR
jgi:hypothetical protein